MFKIEKQEKDGIWHDIKNTEGRLLTFATESEAHAKLEALFPVEANIGKYVGQNHTRVISIWTDAQDADWKA